MEKSSPQVQKRVECSFCHNLIYRNAAFCDFCGTPQDLSHVYQVRSEIERNVETLTVTLQSLESKKATLLTEVKELENSFEKAKLSQKAELESFDDKRKMLTNALQEMIVELASLRNKKGELTNEIEALVSQVKEIKRRPSKSGPRRRGESPTKRKGLHAGINQETTHTFICRYEGRADWNSEFAKLIAQFDLSLDHANYSVSREKIVFTVTGSRDNLEKLTASLNSIEGFTNLRSKLAAAKRSLRETVNARDIHKEQLEALDHVSWYTDKQRITMQRAELGERLAQDEFKIKAISEDVRALESLLASNGAKASEA